MREQADRYLYVNNIVSHGLCFEDFERYVWSETSLRVDLIQSAAPFHTPSNTLSKLPVF